MDSCNVFLQPEKGFTYFIVKCYCHDRPNTHLAEIAKIFCIDNYATLPLFNTEWLHVVELNGAGKKFADTLKMKPFLSQGCASPKICST